MAKNILILILFLSVAFLVYDRQNCKEISNENKATTTVTVTEQNKNPFALIGETCPDNLSNNGKKACTIILLDKLSAEREWKQRKLENLTLNEINKYNASSYTEEDLLNVKLWRESFEKYRDITCLSERFLIVGSGTTLSVVECKLKLEILALDRLNDMYEWNYLTITNSKPLEDFNPSDEQLLEIMNNNKTFRGCIWAGEEECSDPDYTLDDLKNFKKYKDYK